MKGIIISKEEYFTVLDKKLEMYKKHSELPDSDKKYIAIGFERQKQYISNNKLIPIKTIIKGEVYYFIRILTANTTPEELEAIQRLLKYIVDIEKKIKS